MDGIADVDLPHQQSPSHRPAGAASPSISTSSSTSAPLLFHSGPRQMFPLVSGRRSRTSCRSSACAYVGFSPFEADGVRRAQRGFLAVAPGAEPVCGQIAAMTSVDDVATRKARALADGEALSLGRHQVRLRWTRHTSRTPGSAACIVQEKTHASPAATSLTRWRRGDVAYSAVTEPDILGPSEAMRAGGLDRRSGRAAGTEPRKLSQIASRRLAGLRPRRTARVHARDAAWRGGAAAVA